MSIICILLKMNFHALFLFEVILYFTTGIYTIPEPNQYFKLKVGSDDHSGFIGLD